MENWTHDRIGLEGNVIAILLDEDEYTSNVDNVAAISDQQIFYLKRDRHELVNYRYDYFEIPDRALTRRSPGIDYKYKPEAARSAHDFARERGLLRESAA